MRYKEAGVDIKNAERIKKSIKKHVRSTFTPEVVLDYGLFGGAFSLSDAKRYKNPVLITSIDGVGTKLMIAASMNKWDTVGIDLVHHSINDILTTGARPLFFLDYIAASNLNPSVVEQIVKGISVACKNHKIILLAGETAEMPGVYEKNQYDAAGMIAGIVEKNKIINGKGIKPGDKLIGLASNGLHTNGYSLARRVLLAKYSVNDYIPELKNKLGNELIKTHKCYYDIVYPLLGKPEIKGLAHITGGGFDNILRVVPKNMGIKITKNWKTPAIFKLIKEKGNISCKEMRIAFNMGVGFVIIASSSEADAILKNLKQAKEKTYLIGEVTARKGVEFVED